MTAASTRSPSPARRILAPAPRSFLDPATGAPAFGSYEGPLPAIDAAPSLFERFAKRKRWIYAAVASPEIWISIAVVRTGYAATAFAFVYDRIAKTMLADASTIGPTFRSLVTGDVHADGVLASFRFGRTHVSMKRLGARVEIVGRVGTTTVDACLDEVSSPPPIAAIGRIEGGVWDATEKRVLARVTGSASVGDRRFDLDRATGGYDYTHGLLPRHTKWRWGFGLGDASGEPFAFNVVQGFLGEVECGAFFGGRLHAIAEPRFVFDAKNPLGPWRLEGDGIDLSFTPGGMHADATNLGVVRSRFVQPVGSFRGTMRVGDRDVSVADLPGVVEDQDVVW